MPVRMAASQGGPPIEWPARPARDRTVDRDRRRLRDEAVLRRRRRRGEGGAARRRSAAALHREWARPRGPRRAAVSVPCGGQALGDRRGGRTTEWVGGTFAAVAALAAVRRATERGLGEHVDFSLLEVMNIAGTMYSDLLNSMLGRPKVEGTPARTIELPSIEPTLDGWVG